jgi:predicted hotdog family 3-hydroxylacyl-ACP dehydratase
MSAGALDRAGIEALIPHAGAMVLLDQVVARDAERLHARTESHRRADNPLRRGGRLHAIAGSEYGAQAAAVHGPLQGGASGARPGMVVSVRDLTWTRARLDDIDGPLDVHASCLLADSRQLAYAFTIVHAETTLVRGEVGIILS